MNLRLKFIGVNQNDVIATSASGLCVAPAGSGNSIKYLGNDTGNYYIFQDSSGNYNTTGNNPANSVDWTLYRGQTGYTTIHDINGGTLGGPIAGHYYHYVCTSPGIGPEDLYECDNPAHHGTFN